MKTRKKTAFAVNKRSSRKIFNQRGAVRMIYITGDCHADFTRFNTKILPEQYEMTKDDYFNKR